MCKASHAESRAAPAGFTVRLRLRARRQEAALGKAAGRRLRSIVVACIAVIGAAHPLQAPPLQSLDTDETRVVPVTHLVRPIGDSLKLFVPQNGCCATCRHVY